MDKSQVYEAVMRQLRAEFELALSAQREAADYATDEESRAESQYDTQGLEASYLAAGQAAHARELAEAIERLGVAKAELTAPCERILHGALVQCSQGRFRDWYYLAPSGGGDVVQVDGLEVTVITQQSPIAGAMNGKAAGESFVLPNGSEGKILQIL